MAFEWTATWEQAVVAATARAAASHANAGYLGRTALQKILYFLQRSGVPLRYRFDIYHYGPYCDRVTRDAEILLANDVLKDISTNAEKYSNYRPATLADEVLRPHSAALAPHQATIERVVKTLLPLQPDHLELLATLDYVFRWLKAGGGTGPWKDRVIERFMEIKKDKFQKAAVVSAYDSMVQAKLIEA